MKRGRKPVSVKHDEVRLALRHLDDAYELQRSPLVQMEAVLVHAQRTYPQRPCSLGLALSALLHRALRDIAADFSNHRIVGLMARMIEQGETQASVARELTITSEHLTRRWKPVLTELVYHRLSTMPADLLHVPVAAR